MSFNRLEADDFVVSAQAQTQTCWTNNLPSLTSFFTQSNQVSTETGKYYVTVFDQNPTGSAAAAQFEIAYGNSTGGGALAFNQNAAPGVSPASTIYGQYRTLVLEDENSGFVFGGVTGSSIYALSVERSAYKQALFPGSLNLTLSSSIGAGITTLQLTDDSNMVNVPTYYGTMRAYGLNSEETITSDFVFIRARNSEFNYSENPSYISGSTGEVIYDYFINNPQTYITTIGMYNDSNELLAVAKLSKPLNKDFTKEALVRVKLDF